MGQLLLESVFTTSGVPDSTFVRPTEFDRLLLSLRSPGRGVIVEGPSGIGKSTAVDKALAALGLQDRVTLLTAREPGDVEYLDALPELGDFGTVIVDDFHRLDEAVKQRLADLLKVTADSANPRRKLVVIGINEAGRALIQFAPDLANRLDVIRFEVEPDQKVDQLIQAGERALNVTISARPLVVERARGSFYIAQLLCREACLQAGVLEQPTEMVEITTPYAAIQRKVVARQRDRFGETVRSFARGTKFRPGGRAPYLHILRWLAEADSWSINILDEMRKHPSEKVSVGVVLDRGYLADLAAKTDVAKLLHFDSGVLSVEDPMLVFYLRAISWPEFIKEVGFTAVDYAESYDVALSFAGEDREYAEHLRDALEDLGHAVFYDKAELHRFLGEDVEDYLGPIYESGSRYVAAVLGVMYGRKRWTLFEAGKYRSRLDKGEVIPIWASTVSPSPFDGTRSLGGLDYDPAGDVLAQAKEHAEVISRKLASR
ncbi:TIR domain-containing protein [Geodermatophilus sp. SYSU D00766]